MSTGTAAKPQQKTTLTLITPTLARTYLNGNVHNRALRQRIIDKYMRIMKAGKWDTNHQGICFDEQGTLIDGQHRLYAIWLIGQTNPNFAGIWMNVTTDATFSAQGTVDIGLVRSASDILSLRRNEKISTGIVATARMMAGGLRGRQIFLQTIPELEEFIEEHYEALDFVESIFSNKSSRGVSAAGIKAVIARAYYHLPHETLRRFANVLITGLYDDRGDQAAIMLRNYLKDGILNYSKGSNNMAQLVYGKTERALDAFYQRKVLSKAPSPIKDELYPLPHELSAKAIKARTEKELKEKARAKELVTKLKSQIETKEPVKTRPEVITRVNPKNPTGRRIKVITNQNRLATAKVAKKGVS